MKKLFIAAVFLFFTGACISFAECITGYACSIDSLKKNIILNPEHKKKAELYTELDSRENFMCGIITRNLQYMDLFPMVSEVFKTVYPDTEQHSSASAENKKEAVLLDSLF